MKEKDPIAAEADASLSVSFAGGIGSGNPFIYIEARRDGSFFIDGYRAHLCNLDISKRGEELFIGPLNEEYQYTNP